MTPDRSVFVLNLLFSATRVASCCERSLIYHKNEEKKPKNKFNQYKCCLLCGCRNLSLPESNVGHISLKGAE